MTLIIITVATANENKILGIRTYQEKSFFIIWYAFQNIEQYAVHKNKHNIKLFLMNLFIPHL